MKSYLFHSSRLAGSAGHHCRAGPGHAKGEFGALTHPLTGLRQQHVPLPRLIAHHSGQWLWLPSHHRTKTPIQHLFHHPALRPA